MRLIDADALKEDALLMPMFRASLGDVRDVEDLVDDAPTIEAEPVRHGRWNEIEEGEGGHLMECSECKEWLFHNFDYISNYCPNCGAKMDAEVAE